MIKRPLRAIAAFVAALLVSGAAVAAAQSTEQAAAALRAETEQALTQLRGVLARADAGRVEVRRATQTVTRANERMAALAADLQQRRISFTQFGGELDALLEEAVITVWDAALEDARRSIAATQENVDKSTTELSERWSRIAAGIGNREGLSVDARQKLMDDAAPPIRDAERAQLDEAGRSLDGIARSLTATRSTLLDVVRNRIAAAERAKRPVGGRLSTLVEEHLESLGPNAGVSASSFDQLLAASQINVPTIVIRGDPQTLALADRVGAMITAPAMNVIGSLEWLEGPWDAAYRDAEGEPVSGSIEVFRVSNPRGSTPWAVEARFDHPRTNQLLVLDGSVRAVDDAVVVDFFESAGAAARDTRPALTLQLRPADLSRERLDGQWQYDAAPAAADGRQRSGARGPEIWQRRRTAIILTMTADNQTAEVVAGSGMASFRYPFAPGVTGPQVLDRRLVAFGRNLPAEIGEPIKFESSDPLISYELMMRAPARMPELDARYRPMIIDALARLPQPDRDAVGDLQRAVIRATLSKGVLPGPKTFRLNGAESSWVLEFGDNTADIHFVRDVGRETEDTRVLFLPESTRVEVRTAVELPVDRIQVRMFRRGAEVAPETTLVAERVAGSPKTYRTTPIALVQRPPSGGAAAPGQLAVDLYDTLRATVEAPQGFIDLRPPHVDAQVFRTPGQVRGLFKDALRKAAVCNGESITNWEQIPAEVSDRITSTVIIRFEKGKTTWDTVRAWMISPALGLANYHWSPTVYATDITMGHHAAMILMRDVFIEMLSTHQLDMAEIKTDAHLRGFKRLIQPRIGDKSFPLSSIEVTAPDGGRAILSAVYSRDFMMTRYKLSEAQFEVWAQHAFAEGIENYRKSIDRAIGRARETTDCDVMDLLELTGSGFGNVARELAPRLMELRTTGVPPRQEWIPDQQARFAVSGIAEAAGLVRVQRKAANADTQVLLGIGLAIAALPAAAAGGLASVALSIALEAADVALTIVEQGSELHESLKELEFSQGASGVLGTDRFLDAEANKKELGAALAQIGLAAAGGAFGSWSALQEVPSAMATRTFRRFAEQVEREGVDGLRRMTPSQQVEFQRFLAEAVGSRAAGRAGQLGAQEQRALKIFDTLSEDPAVAAVRNAARAGDPPPVGPARATLDPEAPRPPPGADAPGPSPARPADSGATQPVSDTAARTESGLAGNLSGSTAGLDGTRAPPLSPEVDILNNRLYMLRELAKDPTANADALANAARRIEGTRITLPPARRGDPATAVELGEYVGGGTYGQVFKVRGRDDQVVKLFPPRDDVRAAIDGQLEGARLLNAMQESKRVASKPILSVGNEPPAFVMARLEGDEALRAKAALDGSAADNLPRGVEYQVSGNRALTIGEQRAVLDMKRRLADDRLIWEDGALRNMYFFKNRDNVLEAGILDTDRIRKASDPGEALGALNRQIAAKPNGNRAYSLADVPAEARDAAMRDAHFYAEKMLERHGFIDYRRGAGWQPGRMEPKLVEEYFPNLRRPVSERPLASAAPPPSKQPLAGRELIDRAKELEEGQSIRLPAMANGEDLGPITVGKRIGDPDSKFGALYEIKDQPGRLVKIIFNESEPSAARQAAGYRLIADNPRIPAPRVLGYSEGPPGTPSYLIVEDLRQGRWADRNVRLGSDGPLNELEHAAAGDLYRAIGDAGLTWPDGHRKNMFFFTDDTGAVRAGVVDHDMIFRANDLSRQALMVQNRTYATMMGVPQVRLLRAADEGRATVQNAREIMAGLYQQQFKRALDPAGTPPAPAMSAVPPRAPPAANANGPVVPAPSGSRVVDDFQRRLADNGTITVEDIMALQRNTANMRSLKNAPERVRAEFNKLERELVYDPHDDAVIDFVKRNPRYADKDVRVHDFRTPGANAELSINTDRDYRVLYRAPGTDQWLEVPRREWEAFSYDKFAELTGYDPAAARKMLPPAEQARWDRLDDAARRKKWAEIHQQLATDRWHPEASLDFSDQRRANGVLVMDEANVVKVKAGDGELVDARRLGMMYNEKVDVYLRQHNTLEAFAQLNKGTELLETVRRIYTDRGHNIGRLSQRFTEAIQAARSLAPFDARVTPAMLADVDAKLRSLGFRGISDLKDALDSQFASLAFVDAVRR